MYIVKCYNYKSWKLAHIEHKPDFCVYMFDALPIDEMYYDDIHTYIGSAGANAQRNQETKTAKKSASYFRGGLDARYRGGSYTKNHTRPQNMDILCLSRNERLINESKQDWQDRVNENGFKANERLFLGYLEYRLYCVATELNLPLENGEIPKHVNYPDYDNISNSTFFKSIKFEGDVPIIVKIAQGKLTMISYQQQQKQFAYKKASDLLETLNGL